jgi:hypothetical protein
MNNLQEYVMECMLCGHAANSVKIHCLATNDRAVGESAVPIAADVRQVEINSSRLGNLIASVVPREGQRDEDDAEWE